MVSGADARPVVPNQQLFSRRLNKMFRTGWNRQGMASL